MEFRDISKEARKVYRLGENERAVFLMKNRRGETVFELFGRGAEARIVALYDGKKEDSFAPRIVQRHIAPDTVSDVIVRARLDDSSSLRFEGLVEIGKNAENADASQECRALLLSENARAEVKPTLEIRNRNVRCSHAATVSPVNPEHLFYAATRGIPRHNAKKMLAEGFFEGATNQVGHLTDEGKPNVKQKSRNIS